MPQNTNQGPLKICVAADIPSTSQLVPPSPVEVSSITCFTKNAVGCNNNDTAVSFKIFYDLLADVSCGVGDPVVPGDCRIFKLEIKHRMHTDTSLPIIRADWPPAKLIQEMVKAEHHPAHFMATRHLVGVSCTEHKAIEELK